MKTPIETSGTGSANSTAKFATPILRSLRTTRRTFGFDDQSIRYVVTRLQKYEITNSERHAIGDAFEVFIGDALKGKEGQYFTPRNVTEMMVPVPRSVSYRPVHRSRMQDGRLPRLNDGTRLQPDR